MDWTPKKFWTCFVSWILFWGVALWLTYEFQESLSDFYLALFFIDVIALIISWPVLAAWWDRDISPWSCGRSDI